LFKSHDAIARGEALLRAGRFDRQVVVDRPDLQGREAILNVHARSVKLDPQVELKTIAARSPGMVGADLANVVNEAALLAARRVAEAVEMRDFEEAIDRVMLGLEKKSRVMSAAEKNALRITKPGTRS
jgi:cell division protease FtsH